MEIDDGASSNRIGSRKPGARNVLSGNLGGVGIRGAHSNRVFANYIGTDITGTQLLGNQYSGVFIGIAAASNNWVGGTLDGSGNIVTGSGRSAIRGAGIVVHRTAGTGNAIRGNSVFDNLGLGIDIGPPRVTYNDLGDGDEGANRLQNFPVILSAAGATIMGTLNSLPETDFRVELFSNPACNVGPPYGEGETYIGFVDVTTDWTGNVTFPFTPPAPLVSGTFITATATDPERNTSEFSQCFMVP